MKAIKSTSVPQASKKTISSHAVLPQQPDWAKLMAQWESSGLPKSKFCQSRGITYHLFIYHCDKLNKTKKQTEKFIPVKRTQETPTSSPHHNHFILCWPNGAKLSIPDHANSETLKVILSCLEK